VRRVPRGGSVGPLGGGQLIVLGIQFILNEIWVQGKDTLLG
jgi:hypothetical protein